MRHNFAQVNDHDMLQHNHLGIFPSVEDLGAEQKLTSLRETYLAKVMFVRRMQHATNSNYYAHVEAAWIFSCLNREGWRRRR